MASKALAMLAQAPCEPVFTGALLYILTKGPVHVREILLAPLRNNILAGEKGVARLATLIAILKALTAVGVLSKINAALNALAWNNWTLGRAGAPFKFDGRKEELVIVTGGSSGFGYEMVKGFSRIAKVVAIDISDFPPELARCKWISTVPEVQSTC
jgi:all-trans-retinol dehydrogenase (NAD+)